MSEVVPAVLAAMVVLAIVTARLRTRPPTCRFRPHNLRPQEIPQGWFIHSGWWCSRCRNIYAYDPKLGRVVALPFTKAYAALAAEERKADAAIAKAEAAEADDVEGWW